MVAPNRKAPSSAPRQRGQGDVSVSRYINLQARQRGWLDHAVCQGPCFHGVTQDEPSHEGGVASEPAGSVMATASREGAPQNPTGGAAGSAANPHPLSAVPP
eukprot:jgi/Mesvir1/13581/Mv02998-RA.1